MSRIFEYKENYDAIASLPFVQKLLKKVDKLKRKNTKLKEQNKALKTVIYTLPQFMNKKQNKLPKLRKTNDIIIKSECFEPTLCDTLVDDDNEVVFIPNIDKEVETYDLTDNDSHDDAEKENITAVIEEVEEEEDEEEEAEEEVEEEEGEEEEGEEEEGEEEEVEEREGASEGTVGSLEEDEEVFEITIKGKSYYTTNEKSGKIYAIDENEDVGDEIGEFKEGKAVFYKK